MSTTTKKPPTPGAANARRPSANPTVSSSSSTPGPPSRSPSRMSAQGTNATATATAAGLNRTRSVRTGTPVSARAAARKPTASNDADDDFKAEMQAKYEELQEQFRQAEERSTEVQKHAAVLQVKLDEALKEQGMLEESVHEQTERINDLENEKKESLRARREMEQIYESERAASLKEREEFQSREEDMQASMQRMKEALAQREMRAGLDDDRKPSLSRNSSFRNSANISPNSESAGQFAPPSSLQRSDSRSSSKLVMQKDRMIESLRLELAEAQIKLVEMENMGGGRLQKLESEMYDVKVQNGRLMEENESFQLLLSEKTLNGDFAQSDMLRAPSINSSRPSSRHKMGNSLADELEGQEDVEPTEDGRKLQAEISSLKDQNKALTLYINNIISRLLQHDSFEQILDKTPDLLSGAAHASKPPPNADTEKELPPPPPEKDEPTGFLQRARSVMGAKKPRPQSQVFASDQAIRPEESNVTENPETAPRIPLNRSNSRRTASSGHRRANSEWTGASLVNQMYRGTSPGVSPGLASPTSARTSFFGAPQPLTTSNPTSNPSSRVPSGTTVPTIPTIPETATSGAPAAPKDDSAPPQRDSKISTRNSLTSETLDGPDSGPADLSNPSSPPRSVTSSGEGGGRAPGGAIMMGSKMRPLRLVKEAEESESVRKAANRGSWFGWMNKGGAAPGGTSGQ